MKADTLDEKIIEFALGEGRGVSSAEFIRPEREAADMFDAKAVAENSITPERPAEVELSPVFKALAEPKLPALSKENRARLLMQSPNRLYFYWSMHTNPFQTLNRALGKQTGSYTLVLKLVDLKRDARSAHDALPGSM